MASLGWQAWGGKPLLYPQTAAAYVISGNDQTGSEGLLRPWGPQDLSSQPDHQPVGSQPLAWGREPHPDFPSRESRRGLRCGVGEFVVPTPSPWPPARERVSRLVPPPPRSLTDAGTGLWGDLKGRGREGPGEGAQRAASVAGTVGRGGVSGHRQQHGQVFFWSPRWASRPASAPDGRCQGQVGLRSQPFWGAAPETWIPPGARVGTKLRAEVQALVLGCRLQARLVTGRVEGLRAQEPPRAALGWSPQGH